MRKSGWISPRGEFYYCGYMEHFDTAGDICEMLNIPVEHDLTDEALLLNGWIRLTVGGDCLSFREHITQPQLDCLWDLASEADDYYKKHIREFIERKI